MPSFQHLNLKPISRAIISWATARLELKPQALIDHLVQQTCQEAVSYE